MIAGAWYYYWRLRDWIFITGDGWVYYAGRWWSPIGDLEAAIGGLTMGIGAKHRRLAADRLRVGLVRHSRTIRLMITSRIDR